jgi:hypothetical protein
VTKQKDGEDGLIFGYRMEVVQLSDIDAAASSLAVEPLDEAEAARFGIGPKSAKTKKSRLSGTAKKAFQILENVLSKHGQTGQVSDLSRSVKTVKESLWRETYLSESTIKRDSALKSFNRANEVLWTSGTISGSGGYVWISKTYDDAKK